MPFVVLLGGSIPRFVRLTGDCSFRNRILGDSDMMVKSMCVGCGVVVSVVLVVDISGGGCRFVAVRIVVGGHRYGGGGVIGRLEAGHR